MAYAHNTANEYTAIGGQSVSHDAAGNLSADADGYTYEYDHDNRLTKIKKNSGAATVAEFTYDALGRRIEKIDSVAAATTRYYYDGWRVLSETDQNGNIQRSYTYGNYLDETLILTDAADNDYYYAHNHLYSPVALMEDDGDVVERYEYDVYGKCTVYTDKGADSTWFTADDTVDTKSAQDNPIMFTGQRLDPLDAGDLPLMYYKNRFYCYTTGRFLQRDPLGYVDGVNLYEYVTTNPILIIDTYGLTSIVLFPIPFPIPMIPVPVPVPDLPSVPYTPKPIPIEYPEIRRIEEKDIIIEDPDYPGPPIYSPKIKYGRDSRGNQCIKTMTVEGHGFFGSEKDMKDPKASPWAQEFGPGGDPMMGQEIRKRCSEFCCVALIRLEGCRIGLAKRYMRGLARRCPGKRLIVCGCNTDTINVYERILFLRVLKQENVCKGGYTCVRGGP